MKKSGMSLGKRLTLSFTVIIVFMGKKAALSPLHLSGFRADAGNNINDRYPNASEVDAIGHQT